uniref:TrmB family transcriptional regulator n=1 Tax=Thermofilum pendens TaxID=2269 RepID=A0A7C4B9B6_THEPE
MSSNKLQELLRKLGLTSYEAKAYVALVSSGSLTATELASKGEIPQPRVYDVVRSLMEKGLIAVSEGRPKKFTALPPEIALANYVSRKHQQEENALRKVLREFSSFNTEPKEPGVWASAGNLSALNMLEQTVNSARYELVFSGYYELALRIADMLKEDVATCVILYDAPESIPDKLKRFDEVRVRPTRAPVITIPDLHRALLIIGWEEKRAVSYLVTDENLIRILAAYYLGYIRSGSKLVFTRLDSIERRSYVHISRALDHVKALRQAGRKVVVHVKGRRTRDGSPVEFTGEVVGEFENSYRGIGYIRVRLEDGSEISVGGIGAHLEDVEARKIEVVAL